MMQFNLTFLKEKPVWDTRLVLTVQPLAPLSLVQSHIGQYFWSRDRPSPFHIYGMLENALGWHFDENLRKQLLKAAKRENMRKSGAGYQPLLAEHVRVHSVEPLGEVLRYMDVWGSNIAEIRSASEAARHVDARIIPFMADLKREVQVVSEEGGADKIAGKSSGRPRKKKKAGKDAPETVPFVTASDSHATPGATPLKYKQGDVVNYREVANYLPQYVPSPRRREYILCEEGYRIEMVTSASLAAQLKAALQNPEHHLYLGHSEGVVHIAAVEAMPYSGPEPAELSDWHHLVETVTSHVFPRYGYALALDAAGVAPEEATEADVRRGLKLALQEAAGRIMLRAENSPENASEVFYSPVPSSEAITSVEWSNRKPAEGYFPYAHVLMGTNPKNRQNMLAALPRYLRQALENLETEPLSSTQGDQFNSTTLEREIKVDEKTGKQTQKRFTFELLQALSPFGGNFNSGKADTQAARVTLLEYACALLTAITPHKPAYMEGNTRKAFIPDLPLEMLPEYLGLIRRYLGEQEYADAQGRSVPPTVYRIQRDKLKPGATVEMAQCKPPAAWGNTGNYESTWGFPIGFLSKLGYWAGRYNNLTEAKKIIGALRDVYSVGMNGVEHTRFPEFITALAQEGTLRDILSALALRLNSRGYHTRLMAHTPVAGGEYQKPPEKDGLANAYYGTVSRFLQYPNPYTWGDFISHRAIYGAGVRALIHAYYERKPTMNLNKDAAASTMTPDQIKSMMSFGRAVGLAAYIAAKTEVERKSNKAQNTDSAYVQNEIAVLKDKYILELEGMVLSAASPFETMHRVTRFMNMCAHHAPPVSAQPFIQDVFQGNIPLSDAKSGLLTAVRLIHANPQKATAQKEEGETSEATGGAEGIEDIPEDAIASSYEDVEASEE